MAVKLFCEVCGEHMGTLTKADIKNKDIKSFYSQHGDTCGRCIKTEQDLKEFVEKKRGFFLKKFDLLAAECREHMVGEVERLLEERAKETEVRIIKEKEEESQKIIEDYKKIKKLKFKDDFDEKYDKSKKEK